MSIALAIIGLLSAIAGAVAWYYRSRAPELNRERALNDVLVKHQSDTRLSIVEAEKRAAEGRAVADKALAGELAPDDLRCLRAGRLPGHG